MPENAVQLRRAEERREAAEARARELEKQVSYISLYYYLYLQLGTFIRKFGFYIGCRSVL
jgi:hypothetical protein